MFTKSIRWRLLLWLAFLLVCILSGFGVTAYQLHRTNQFNQIDEVLKRRVAALSADVRGRGPFGQPRGHPPFDHGPDRPPPGFGPPDSKDRKGPRDFGPGPPEMRSGSRQLRLSE